MIKALTTKVLLTRRYTHCCLSFDYFDQRKRTNTSPNEPIRSFQVYSDSLMLAPQRPCPTFSWPQTKSTPTGTSGMAPFPPSHRFDTQSLSFIHRPSLANLSAHLCIPAQHRGVLRPGTTVIGLEHLSEGHSVLEVQGTNVRVGAGVGERVGNNLVIALWYLIVPSLL